MVDHVDDAERSRYVTTSPAGVSLGGYYAPRAAAFEKRIKACIALGGPYEWQEHWDGLPELTRAAFRVRSHCATDAEAKRHAMTLSLKGVAQNITCPIFVMTCKLDRLIGSMLSASPTR